MANVSRTVDIIFNADDRVTKAVKSISASLDQLDRIAMKIVDPFAALGKGVIAADAALTAIAVGGLAIAIKSAGEFNEQFAEISTLVQATAEDLESFRGNIIQYAASSTQSIDNITAAIYTAISAGIDYADSIDFVTESEKLAVAGRADLESTTRLMASTLNAYGASTEEAARYSDVFFKTVELGLTTIPELAGSMAQVSTIAAQAGIPIETLSAAIATLTAAGLPTEKAMTSLRTAISNIISPSEGAKSAAAELGIQYDAAALKSRGFENILKDVFTATEGNVGAVSELFGNVRGLGSALVLGGDVAGKFTNALEEMRNATGATAIAFEKMQDSFTYVNQRLLNNIEVLLITIGTKLEAGYADTVNAITKIFQSLSSAINEGVFNDIFAAFDNFGDRLSRFLSELAEALPEALTAIDFSPLLDALDEIGVKVLGLFDDIDLTDPEDLADVLQDIINTIASLVTISGGMIEVFGDVFKLIKTGIDDFNNLGDASKESLGKLAAGAIIIQEAGLYLGSAILTLADSGYNLKGTFEFIADSIKFLFHSVRLVTSEVAVAVASTIYGFLTVAEAVTFGMVDTINEARTAVGEFVAGGVIDIEETSGKLDQLFKDTEGSIDESMSKAAEDVKKVGQAVDEDIPDSKIVKTGAAWDTLQAGIIQEQIDKDIPEERSIEVIPTMEPKSVIDIKARLEAEAKIMEKSLELQAEIDIAQIEADTERIKAAFESINVAIQDTGDVITALFGQLAAGDIDIQTRWNIEQQIREENERREASLELQKALTEAQIAALRARITAFQRGDPLITVNAEGLEPHLEAIFFYILEQIQIRVNEEQQDFLLGINP